MKSPFLSAARVALDDIVRKHAKESKYGYFLTEDHLQNLVGELLDFVEMSRNLRVAGDKLLKSSLSLDKPSASREALR
ncbi:MAG: hypothetical protein HYW48_00320 [Deltaproteobacteria bacterium]|nr:hypothetical protein [Deltaproteobacteria bacterium]